MFKNIFLARYTLQLQYRALYSFASGKKVYYYIRKQNAAHILTLPNVLHTLKDIHNMRFHTKRAFAYYQCTNQCKCVYAKCNSLVVVLTICTGLLNPKEQEQPRAVRCNQIPMHQAHTVRGSATALHPSPSPYQDQWRERTNPYRQDRIHTQVFSRYAFEGPPDELLSPGGFSPTQHRYGLTKSLLRPIFVKFILIIKHVINAQLKCQQEAMPSGRRY